MRGRKKRKIIVRLNDIGLCYVINGVESKYGIEVFNRKWCWRKVVREMI